MMHKIIIYLFPLLVLIISCNGQEKKDNSLHERRQNIKKDTLSETINFLDLKYQKEGYSIPDNLTDNLNPSYSFFDINVGGFTVDYIGKTKKERDFWDIKNSSDYFNNDLPEDKVKKSNRIRDILKTRKDNYYIIANYLDKKYIQNFDVISGEFDITENAERKIYLYSKNNKWEILKSIKSKDIPEDYLKFCLDLLKSNGKIQDNKNEKLSDSIVFPKISTWSSDCNQKEYRKDIIIETNINNVQFSIYERFSMNAQLKKIDTNKYEFYFTDFPPIIPLPDNMQIWVDMDNTKPVGMIEIVSESKLILTWFGFYHKKLKKNIETENPFDKNNLTAVLVSCKK